MIVSRRLGFFLLLFLIGFRHSIALSLPDVRTPVSETHFLVAQLDTESQESESEEELDSELSEELDTELVEEESEHSPQTPLPESKDPDTGAGEVTETGPEAQNNEMDDFLDELDDERGFLFEAGEETEKDPVAGTEAGRPESQKSGASEESMVIEGEGELVEEGEGELVHETPFEDNAPKETIVRKNAEDVAVKEEQAINFAEGLREYRSPKLAMLMSLFVPGLGQAYAKNYWKMGAFAAVEIAGIATAVGFARKGNYFAKEAHAHADTAYSYDRFANYYDSLYNGLIQRKAQDPDASPADQILYADSVMKWAIFGQWNIADTVKYPETARTSFDTAYFRTLIGDEDFYQWIEDDMFVQGWKDSKPRPTPGQIASTNRHEFSSGDTLFRSVGATSENLHFKYNAYLQSDTTRALNKEDTYGFSHYYETYKHLLDERNRRDRIALNVLYVVILNHIVSAIDAGITAKSYNDRLLGRKSIWHRIELEQTFVDVGTETVPGLALRLGF